MIGAVLACVAAAGVYFLYSSVALGRHEVRLLRDRRGRASTVLADWLIQAGLHEVRPIQFATVAVSLGAAAGLAVLLLFGGTVPAVVATCLCGVLPVVGFRARRSRALEQGRQAWPHLIEEIRLQAGALGRSIPQALFEVGSRAPGEMRAAFSAAEREWMLSTDFARTVRVLKGRLADPTADAVCETLLVAHEVGGSELDHRLAALVDDRIQELEGRRDAVAKQAGARFARRFVLLVPLGMALVGLSIGDGRASYETPAGQIAVAVAITAVVACWLWAGRLMALPREERVFRD